MKLPYSTATSGVSPTAGAITNFKLLKLIFPNIIPKIGIIISSTSEVTILPKAAPIITPTARSITFPLEIKSLNSLNIKYSPLKFFLFIIMYF